MAVKKKLGDIVVYQDVPAIVTAIDKAHLTLTIFALTGPYVQHDVPAAKVK